MAIEFQKPTFRPEQLMPEQALSQAFHQGSKVNGMGSEKMSPCRIWSIVLNDVVMMM